MHHVQTSSLLQNNLYTASYQQPNPRLSETNFEVEQDFAENDSYHVRREHNETFPRRLVLHNDEDEFGFWKDTEIKAALHSAIPQVFHMNIINMRQKI